MAAPAPRLAPVDFSPLDRPAPASVVRRFERGLHGGLHLVEWMVFGSFAAVAVAIAVVAAADALPAGAYLLAAAVALVASGLGAWRVLRNRTEARLRARSSEFARVNGFRYRSGEVDPVPGSTGGLFRLGKLRSWSELIEGERGRPFAFFSYSYVTEKRDAQGRTQRTTHSFRAAKVTMARPLPPIWGQRRAGFDLPRPEAPFWPARYDAKLSLEGDFDRHFKVRVTEGRQADALYILAPDVMADLVDHLGEYSFEIAGDALWLYAADSFDLADRARFREVLEAIDTVGARIGRLSERYTDA